MPRGWNPQQILEEALAFQSSRLLLTAAELDLFTRLRARPLSAREISSTMGLDFRAADLLLHALVALGLLEESPEGFRTPEPLARWLVSDSDESVLPMILHAASLWKRWGDLTGVIRRGRPEERDPWIERSPEERDAFIRAMHVVGRAMAPEIVAHIPLEGVGRLLDVGGASGTYTIAFLESKPDLRVTLFDLPPVIPLARERLERIGLLGRVDLVGGDFDQDPFPPGHDLAFLSAIVHQNDRAQNRTLFGKVRGSLVPGGTIVVRDHVMEPSRNEPAAGALFAVNMLVGTRGGSTYTFRELQEDLERSGFHRVEWIRRGDRMDSLVIAARPQVAE